MDPRLLKYYNAELQYMREMGAEFASEYPKIAARLGLDQFECADPYVERLLEGFSFLAARIQLKMDAEYPTFTSHLLETIYPHCLAPIPSMLVAQFTPAPVLRDLPNGYLVPRGTTMKSITGKGDQTACSYQTSQDTTLWPLELIEAEYSANFMGLTGVVLPGGGKARAAIRLRLRSFGDKPVNRLQIDRLPLYLRGSEDLPGQLYERLLANTVGMVALDPSSEGAVMGMIPGAAIKPSGFSAAQALLPTGPRNFSGYRLLQEYFAFPARFLFTELTGLSGIIGKCGGSEMDLLILLDRTDPVLETMVSKDNFALYCTPAVNLFPKRADRIHLKEGSEDFQVIPDRTHPQDFEIHSITRVTGYSSGVNREQEFRPFFAPGEKRGLRGEGAYYTKERRPRRLSTREQKVGTRSQYVGSEVFLALVDPTEAPYSNDLGQLALETLCTNRDLPLHMPLGVGNTDFNLDTGGPVAAIRCLSGPSKPRPAMGGSETAWHLISHLSLNHLSLVDNDPETGAQALRQLLELYVDPQNQAQCREVAGVKSINSRPITRWLTLDGMGTVVRGLEITITFNEDSFKGIGPFLLGAVLEDFFAHHVAINSFTETVIKTEERGIIKRWPARNGQRHIL